MKQIHAGFAGRLSLALVAALVMTLAFAVVVSAKPAEPLAPDIPNLPHFFYGTVTTDKGVPLPGMLVTAQAVSGSWTGTSSTTADSLSRYGYTPQFYVPGWDSGIPGSGARTGDQIAFYVGGVQATLYDVAAQSTSSTYTFLYGGNTELNLIIPLYYTITPTAGTGCTITPGTPQSVPYKGSQSFTIAANTGYDILDVLVNGVSQGAITSYTFTNVTSSGTIHATCKPEEFTITPTAGAGGTITPGTPQTVNYGNSITFTITPNASHLIKDVLVDGVSVGAVSTYTFTNVTANHTIAATFKIKTFVIKPTAGANGTITPGTDQTVDYGGSATFTITPNACYQIDDVKVDGVSVGAVSTYTFSNVTADHAIAATFKIKTFVITPTAGANGTIAPNTPQTVNCGSSVTFTITPSSSHRILDVKVDGASVGAVSTYTFTNVTANHTIEATFTIRKYIITPTAGAGGTITPGTAQTVNHGSSITFTITPDACNAIADVLVDGVSQGPITSYTFTNVTANHTIMASFAMRSFVITPAAGAGGTITPGTLQMVNCGGSATFTIAPDATHNIIDVQVDGVSQGPITTYTFSNVTANHTISATFDELTFVITPTAGAGGTITPNTAQIVKAGDSATFTIAPDSCYEIDDVKVDGVSQGALATYTFTNVMAHHTIAATFKIKTFVITPTAGPNGTITPGTPQTVNCGGSAIFTIAPNTGYVILDVKVDGVSQGPITTYAFTNVTANHTIAAEFTTQPFVITPSAGANGTITPGTPQTVGYGSNATFTITPDACYEIDDVKVDGVSQGALATYTFTNVTADHTIDATFKIKTFVITPTAGPNGTITPGTPQTVNCGGSATFTLVPDPGYLIADCKVDGVSQGALATYTFTDVTANHTIDATFVKQIFRIFLPFITR